MKIIVDIGNTLTKIAVFNKMEMVDFTRTECLSQEIVKNLLAKYPAVSTGIMASVKNIDPALIRFLRSKINLLQLDAATPLPFQNKYITKQSLGYDRIAAIAGASEIYPKNNTLVINAGTCITYDLITAENEYLGGGISPGIRIRFNSLNTFTNKLPLIEPNDEQEADLVGSDTEKSILSGVLNGIIAEVDGIIKRYKLKFPELKIIISGGDYKYFDRNLKNNIFATPNIVLKGLNRIHDFNEKA
jgi:type III pantothenate kinase